MISIDGRSRGLTYGTTAPFVRDLSGREGQTGETLECVLLCSRTLTTGEEKPVIFRRPALAVALTAGLVLGAACSSEKPKPSTGSQAAGSSTTATSQPA